MKKSRSNSGQAVLEYILLVVMLAVTVATAIRNSNFLIYCYWTGLANIVALPCPGCTSNSQPPEAERCLAGTRP